MIFNILKTTWRNIVKQKMHALTNLFGLSLGFTAFILVSLYMNFEYSWDQHNVNYKRIYRVQRHFVKARNVRDGNNISPHSRGITAMLLKNKYPEIEETAIIKELGGEFISSKPGNLIYDEKEGFAAEQSLLNMFTYDFISGDEEKALKDPFSIILSESLSRKLFSHGQALGKEVMIEKKYPMKVTGIYRDLPYNSIIRPNYIVSLSTLKNFKEDAWNSMDGNYMTFILLKPDQDYKALNNKIRDLFIGYKEAEYEKIELRPLSKLHLNFNDHNAYENVLSLFSLVGIFILVLAGFNYINLTTAQTAVRVKEIVVRKVHGSSQRALILQFLGETVFLSIIAVVMSYLIAEFLLPVFNRIVQKPLNLSFATEWKFIIKTSLITLLTGILAGIYPAFFMSSKNIAQLNSGNIFKTGKNNFSLKKMLVIFQFAVSMFLIIITLIFTLQIKYLLNKDLGIDKENILYATLNITRKTCYEDLSNRILQHHEIINCAMSEYAPFVSHGGGTVNWEGCLPDDVLEIRNNTVSYDFTKHFKISILDGRDFSRDFPSDAGRTCLINETAKRDFGYNNPIGKRIDNGRLQIVGVMKDFHFKDMYNTIEPVIFKRANDTIYGGRWTFSFRVIPGKTSEARNIIQKELETYFPDDPFDIRILDHAFRNENVFKILGSVNNSLLFFTILNVLLAVLGLLGLVSFTIQRRMKEIGLRKINGSSPISVFLLLTKEYLNFILIASLISWPFGYIAFLYLPANYKVPFPYWLFGFASLAIIIISLLTSLYYTVKASWTNPVDVLRYE